MKYTLFGESHGPAVGVVLEGLPAGLTLDIEAIHRELARRAPGNTSWSTARKEADRPEIISGLFHGRTTGAPLTALIPNSDAHSGDYELLRTHPRPGHADYPAWVKYGGNQDYRGGGHFSARLTAPLVFAGAVAKQLLLAQNIYVAAHISNIYGIPDTTPEHAEDLLAAQQKDFPVLNEEAGEEMRQAILEAKEEGDSVGGAIECVVWGLPAGFGGPGFGENAEGIFAQYLFAVPAVKAVGFGMGAGFSLMRGSEANDPLRMVDGTVQAQTNYAGGVNGGITNGMPLVFEVTLRPTPSIAQPQPTVDLESGEDFELTLRGRHDPCVVPRAVPVIEAAAALATCELLGI